LVEIKIFGLNSTELYLTKKIELKHVEKTGIKLSLIPQS